MLRRSFVFISIFLFALLHTNCDKNTPTQKSGPRILSFTLNGENNTDNVFKLAPMDTVNFEIAVSDSDGVVGYTQFQKLSDGRTWHSLKERKMGSVEKVTILKGKSVFADTVHAAKIGDTMRTTIGVYDAVNDTSKFSYTIIYVKK